MLLCNMAELSEHYCKISNKLWRLNIRNIYMFKEIVSKPKHRGCNNIKILQEKRQNFERSNMYKRKSLSHH